MMARWSLASGLQLPISMKTTCVTTRTVNGIMWHIMGEGDSQVPPEGLSRSVLTQPKTSSDAHLTPCACHKVGQGQPLPALPGQKAHRIPLSSSPSCQSCFLSPGASQTEIRPVWGSFRQRLHLHRPYGKARQTTAFSTNPFLQQANPCSPLQVSIGKGSN